MMDARHLTKALADPPYVLGLDAKRWAALLAMADAEQLTGSLSWRLDGLPVPEAAAAKLAEARQATEVQRAEVLREAAIVSQALAPAGNPVILLNQAAFVAAGLDAARGLHIANLEILVPQAAADDVGAAVRRPGGPAPGLPIKVHCKALPVATDPQPLGKGLWTLSHEDMVVHAVAQSFAAGDLSRGLHDLWTVDRLIREFSDKPDFWKRLHAASARQGMTRHLSRALRLSRHLFETPVCTWLAWEARRSDVFYLGRLLARNSEGKAIRGILRFAFRLRARWIALFAR